MVKLRVLTYLIIIIYLANYTHADSTDNKALESERSRISKREEFCKCYCAKKARDRIISIEYYGASVAACLLTPYTFYYLVRAYVSYHNIKYSEQLKYAETAKAFSEVPGGVCAAIVSFRAAKGINATGVGNSKKPDLAKLR